MNDPLNNLEATIMHILKSHRGKDNAISRGALVDAVNGETPLFPVHERGIREAIKHLVTQHGERIGSCVGGYFLIETFEELEKVCRYYHSYGLSSLFVEARLRRVSLPDLLGQLSMEFK